MAAAHERERLDEGGVVLVGVGDGRIQHHRPAEVVASSHLVDAGGGGRAVPGDPVRDRDHAVRISPEALEHRTPDEVARHRDRARARFTDRGRTALRYARLARPWVARRSSGCRSWIVST